MASHEITIFAIFRTSVELENSKFPGKPQDSIGLEPSKHLFSIANAPEVFSPDEEVKLTCGSL